MNRIFIYLCIKLIITHNLKQANIMAMVSKKRETKNYALIYFRDKKPLKKPYDTASRAFYDYEDKGCILVELYNERGILLVTKKSQV